MYLSRARCGTRRKAQTPHGLMTARQKFSSWAECKLSYLMASDRVTADIQTAWLFSILVLSFYFKSSNHSVLKVKNSKLLSSNVCYFKLNHLFTISNIITAHRKTLQYKFRYDVKISQNMR